MSKLNRILWTGLVLGIAACGDDVTVVQPPEPTPGIRSVTVAPDGITLAINATAQMTAAVVTDPGATGTPTIAWSTSSATVATVSATGLVTGKAAGSVGITATATLGTSTASGVATVNVTAQTTTPATVSINSITYTPAGTPAELTNIFGGVNVKLNLDRGGEKVTKVQLLVDNVVVSEQAFASASAQAAAPELAIEELNMPWNTAAFDAVTGATKHLNGEHTLSAKVVTVQNASGSASPSVKVILMNSNTWIITRTVDGISANDQNGKVWWRGDLTVKGLPVIYSVANPVISSATIYSCLGSEKLTEAPWEFTWTEDDAAAGVETSNCSAGVSNSTLNNNSGPTGSASGDPLRYDNNGPSVPTFHANPNIRQNGWLNAAVGLTTRYNSSTAKDGWVQNAPSDGGVGGVVVQLRIGDNVDGSVDAALAATPSATPTLPARTATNVTKCAVLSAVDALGNESDLPEEGDPCTTPPAGSNTSTGTTSLLFGVDLDAPTIKFSNNGGTLADQARITTANVGGEFEVTVADTGVVGNSGMLGGAPVVGTVTARNTTGTTGCYAGTVVSGVCTASATGFAAALPLVATNNVAGQTTLGYYTFSGYAQDAAGNKSGSVTRVVVRDNTVPVASTPSVPINVVAPFSAASFLNDDLSLRDYYYTVGYSAIAPVPVKLGSATVIDGWNAATFNYSNYALNSQVDAYQGLQDGTGASPVAYAGAVFNSLTLYVRDQTSAYQSANTLVTAKVPAAGIDITNFTGAFAITTSNNNICYGAGCASSTKSSTVFSVKATGATAVFNNPFSRIDLYGNNGTNLILVGSITGGAASLVDNGSTRVFTWTYTLTSSSAYALLGAQAGANIHAFGVDAAGSKVALVSAPVVQQIVYTP
jgi:hypothetical protein